MAAAPDRPTHDVYALYRDGEDEECGKIGTVSLNEDGTGSFHLKWVPTSGWRNRGWLVPVGSAPPDIPKPQPKRAAPPPPSDTFAEQTGDTDGRE